MSLHDTLIYGLKTLWVNAVEQYDKSAIEFAGPGVSVAVANNRNVVTIAPTVQYATGTAGGGIVTGTPVSMIDGSLLPWSAPWSASGIAINSGGAGDQISVQAFGETKGIAHALWTIKPGSEDMGNPVYLAGANKYRMVKSAVSGTCNQQVGIVWHATSEPTDDTTTILLNIQPPVIVPAS